MRLLLLALLLMGVAVPASAQKDKLPDPDSMGVYELRAVTAMPRPINVAELQEALESSYPAALRDAMVGGEVEVRFRVDAQGLPHDLAITRTTHNLFDEPTLNAVRKLRFAPAEVNGKPVQVWVVLPIQWTVPAVLPPETSTRTPGR